LRSNGNLEKVWEELNLRLKAKFGTDRFTAHLTIARVKTRLTRSQIEKIFSHKKQEFGSFVLSPEMIVLKKSTLTPEGPIYSNL
jgi:2'-5' RNA ligase